MNSKIMHRLATNPKAHMDFVTQGKTPSMRSPSKSPLWVLLNSLGNRELSQIQGIKLGPELGYQTKMSFSSAHHLFRWLGGRDQVGDWETIPAESYQIRGFSRQLTMDDLKANSARGPWT